MQIVSNKYKEYLNNSLSISPKSKIVVDDKEYLGDVIKTSPKFSHSNSTFIGGFPAKTVSFDIYNFNNDLDFENKEIKVYKGIVINGIVEWVRQGIFIAQSKDITNNISTKIMSISKAQDKTQLFDSKYESTLNWENEQTHTGLEIVQEICTKLDVTLGTNDFSWANYNFKQPNFVEDITYREVVSRIAQIGGEIAFINNDGVLVIKNQTLTGDKIQRKRYKNLSKEKLHTVNTVILGKEGMNDDIKYPETITTDRVEFKINDNPFVDLYREEMISTVAEYIIGKSYNPFSLDDFVDGFIYELNDVVTIIDKNGEEFDAVILDYSSSSRIKSNIKADTPDKNNTDYKLAGSSKEEIRKVKLDVDHINKNITAMAETQGEHTSKIAKLEINDESIGQSVSSLETDINNNYTSNEELEQILQNQKNTITTEMTTQYQQDMDSFSFDIINKINQDGVTSLKNTMVTIDENGINTAKNNEDVVSLLDNQGVYVSDGKKQEDNSNVIMKVDRNGGYFKTLETKSTIKEQDLIQKEKIDDETYGECQGWYWIGSDI